MNPGRTTFQFSSAASRSPVENVYYRDSDFYTTSTLGSAFSRNKFIKNFVVDNVSYINPATLERTVYNTTPLGLQDETVAVTGTGQVIPLTAASISRPDAITQVPAATFTLRGKVDLSSYPAFPATGTILLYVDRNATAVPAKLNPDGSFESGPITLDDNQSWYRDRHYVAVNLFDTGINMTTMVYQVVVQH